MSAAAAVREPPVSLSRFKRGLLDSENCECGGV